MKPLRPSLIRATLLVVACLLSSCGGGSSATPPPAGIQVPGTTTDAGPAFTLTPTAIRTFRFTWNDTADETGYRLLEDPDGASGYTLLATLPAGTTQYEHEVFLPERVNARYRLQVCKHLECVDAAELSASGPLTQAIGYFKAGTPADGDFFGDSLALSADGRFLAVGAPGWGARHIHSGSVYVFARDGTAWRQQARLAPDVPEAGGLFGVDVALSRDGTTLAVGASNTTGPADRSGVVFVFSRQGEAWGPPVRVTAQNAGADDQFGFRIALSEEGDTLAVGADNESGDATTINGPDNDNKRKSGAAYVFARSGAGWTQQAYIKAPNADTFDFFGQVLALSADGRTLAVGAIGEDSAARGIDRDDPNDDSAVDSGAVYVFGHGLNGWGLQAYVKASNTMGGAAFGSAIALSANGQRMAVGSPYESSDARGIDGDQANNGADRSGAVYVFARQGTQWGQSSYIKASNADADDNFGTKLALSMDGDTLAVGAPGEGSDAQGLQGDQDSNAVPRTGAVYLFRRGATAWRQQAYIKPSNTASGDARGFGGDALSLSSDADDLGVVLAVGCAQASNAGGGIGGDQTDRSGSDVGAVYLY